MCDKGLLTVADLKKRWRVSASTLYRWMDNPAMKFPMPVNRPKQKPVVWTESAIAAFEKSKGWT